MAVIVIDSTDGRSIDDFAQGLFNKWGIGKPEVDNGVMILIAVEDREWRIHIGPGMEEVLTEELLIEIMEEHAEPEFRMENIGQGIINAAEELRSILESEPEDCETEE